MDKTPDNFLKIFNKSCRMATYYDYTPNCQLILRLTKYD